LDWNGKEMAQPCEVDGSILDYSPNHLMRASAPRLVQERRILSEIFQVFWSTSLPLSELHIVHNFEEFVFRIRIQFSDARTIFYNSVF
jgi:hypothetical protein